jgi:Tol biopolymer transport system component
MFRRVFIACVVLLALVAATSRASSTTISPCRQVSMPTWSPDGKQIAFYGRRWPPPTTAHRNPNSILQGLCTMTADGTNAQPLRYTVCSERCPDPPGSIVWLQTGILYLRDGAIFRIVPGSKPQKVAQPNAVSIVTNPAGTRIAIDRFYSGCLSCVGPVTILDARSGAVVGTVGGKKLQNSDPSLSPDGTMVAFERNASNNSGKTFGIWTAKTNGSALRRLVKVGQQPLWSPTGGKIAYLLGKAPNWPALLLVPSQGGRSTTLVRSAPCPSVGRCRSNGVLALFGWSPDGKSIAFETSKGKLAIVDASTGKVRSLLSAEVSAAAWSPDSSELVANSVPKGKNCGRSFAAKPWLRWSTWRVPVDGSKPTLISSCTS